MNWTDADCEKKSARKGAVSLKSKDLILANKIQDEIDELDSFIRHAEQVWAGKLIQRTPIITFKSKAYGVIDSCEYELNTKMKNRVLDVLREHLESLKKKLTEI